jgi:hypothetical protein
MSLQGLAVFERGMFFGRRLHSSQAPATKQLSYVLKWLLNMGGTAEFGWGPDGPVEQGELELQWSWSGRNFPVFSRNLP